MYKKNKINFKKLKNKIKKITQEMISKTILMNQ